VESVELIVDHASSEAFSDSGSGSEIKQIPTKKDFKLIASDNILNAANFRFELIYSTLKSQNKDMALIYLEKDSYFRLSVSMGEGNVDGM
jgi:hypothetical protein